MALARIPLRRGSYHGSMLPWRRGGVFEGKHIGVEWEVESNSGDCYDVMRAFPDHDPDVDGPAPLFETDGSLCVAAGVEIVFPPVALASLRDENSYLCRAFKAVGDGPGIREGKNNCGMHMNINVRGWSRWKKALFAYFIHNVPNAALATIGGRVPTHYCQQAPGQSVSYYGTHFNGGHAYAIEHKGDTCMEARFPQATAVLTKIRELANFFDWLDDWAEERTRDIPQTAAGRTQLDALFTGPNARTQVAADFADWLRALDNEEATAMAQVISRA